MKKSLFTIFQGDTLNNFCKLDIQEQLKTIKFLNTLPLYIEAVVDSQKYLLVHVDLPEFSDIDISLYDEELYFQIKSYKI